MPYVDGYVLAVPSQKLAIYRAMARKAGKVFREHGALEYRECVGEDLDVKGLVPFPSIVKPKRGETIVFAWIIFKSKADRNRVNAAVMKDPRLAHMAKDAPFDPKRMIYGGFKTIVDL
jgi:uncharacterized protein YbaA (DUF1428 family)